MDAQQHVPLGGGGTFAGTRGGAGAGSVWRNSEDEILKAAVMKYGTNQWARISSLLARKTPKQCKARWNEWIDPAVRKGDWSPDEDAQLLHLVRVMPTQWRSIAPAVGRTAAQCLERYNTLLAAAASGPSASTQAQNNVASSSNHNAQEPTRAGVDPESRPARPDVVDMDDEELEMLAEARARLANTQGKKAKRKARERQLEEARRLAALQKQRELKQAGIAITPHSRRSTRGATATAPDLADVIPYQREAPEGPFDTSREDARAKAKATEFKSTLLEKLDGKRKADVEADNRTADAKRIKAREQNGDYLPASVRKLREEQEAASSLVSNRKPLDLPAPSMIPGKSMVGDITSDIVTDDDVSTAGEFGNGTQNNQRAMLQSLFSALPKAKNTVIEDLEQDSLLDAVKTNSTTKKGTSATKNNKSIHEETTITSSKEYKEPVETTNIGSMKDAGEIERKKHERATNLQEELLRKRSTPFKRKLPIPDVLPVAVFDVVKQCLEHGNDDVPVDLDALDNVFYFREIIASKLSESTSKEEDNTTEATTKKKKGSKATTKKKITVTKGRKGAKSNKKEEEDVEEKEPTVVDNLDSTINAMIAKEACKLVAYDSLKSIGELNEIEELKTALSAKMMECLVKNAEKYDDEQRNDPALSLESLDVATALISEEAKLTPTPKELDASYMDWAKKVYSKELSEEEQIEKYKFEWKILRKMMSIRAAESRKIDKKFNVMIAGFKNIYEKSSVEIAETFKSYVDEIIEEKSKEI